MDTQPLTPDQVDALLRPDPRTTSADLLVLRDALHRLGEAWVRLGDAATRLEGVALALERRDAAVAEREARTRDAERPRPTPPRAD